MAIPFSKYKGYSININTKGDKLNQTIELLKYLTSSEVQLYFTKGLNTQPSSIAALACLKLKIILF